MLRVTVNPTLLWQLRESFCAATPSAASTCSPNAFPPYNMHFKFQHCFSESNIDFFSSIIAYFQVNKSAGPFDALLCVGQFFPDSPEQLEEFNDYIEGRSKLPIPTYFIGDYGVGAAKILSAVARDSANLGFKMDGLKVCENLYWLRGSGKFLLHGI